MKKKKTAEFAAVALASVAAARACRHASNRTRETRRGDETAVSFNHFDASPLFFFDKTYMYYWIRKTYIDTYKYKCVLQGYRDSCTDQTAKETLKESKITLKSPTPMLAFFAGDGRCRTLPSTKTPEPP